MATVSQFRGKGYNFNDNLDNIPLESTPSSGEGQN
jgi:hypothetical protein